MQRLEGKVALVTGGAAGIGAAVVRRFVEEGCKVVVTDVDEQQGHALVRELGDAVVFSRGDHRVMAENQAAVDAALRRFGGLDILVNNAGVPCQGAVGDMDDPVVERVVGVNLLGPYRMTQAALPALRSRGSGADRSILFTASIQAIMVRPGFTVYGMTKHGVAGLVGSLALELAPEGIRVNALCPGPVDTELFRQSVRDTADSPETARERFRQGIPLGRLIEPQEVAVAALFLASAEASGITGVLLPVDGGITAR